MQHFEQVSNEGFYDLFSEYLGVIHNQMRWDEMRHRDGPLHSQQVPRWQHGNTQYWMRSNLDQIKQITQSHGEWDETRVISRKCASEDQQFFSQYKMSFLFTSSLRKTGILSSLCNKLSRSDTANCCSHTRTIAWWYTRKNSLASKSAAQCCKTRIDNVMALPPKTPIT